MLRRQFAIIQMWPNSRTAQFISTGVLRRTSLTVLGSNRDCQLHAILYAQHKDRSGCVLLVSQHAERARMQPARLQLRPADCLSP